MSTIDAIHRMRTDPGRLTKSWFDGVMAAGISHQAYVEMVSVVNSSVIIDTLHRCLDLELPALPAPIEGEPGGAGRCRALQCVAPRTALRGRPHRDLANQTCADEH